MVRRRGMHRILKSPFQDALSIARYHIVLIAMTASLVFGWLTTGRYGWLLAYVVGLDWFLINLFNKVTDVEEDLKNGIPGTERVLAKKQLLTALAYGLLIGSFAEFDHAHSMASKSALPHRRKIAKSKTVKLRQALESRETEFIFHEPGQCADAL